MPQSDPQAVLAPVSSEIQAMMDAGVFYGSTRTKTHPRMKRFVAANRNEIEIIDLEKTIEMAERAAEVIAAKGKGEGSVLLVGTQPHAQEGTKELAEAFGFPYVTTRWLGGTLTNYEVISKRIEWYKKLKQDKAAGVFEKYTKKEQLDIAKQIEKLQGTLGGLEKMIGRPQLLVLVDPVVHHTALREARRMKIPVVAFVSTNCDPDEISYPVVGNTKAKASVAWFLERVRDAVEKGRRDAADAKNQIAKESNAKENSQNEGGNGIKEHNES